MSRSGVQPSVLAACIVIFASIAAALPDDAVPLDPRAVFDECREVYQGGPWAERVSASIRLNDGDERRGSFVLRAEPTTGGDLVSIRLEAGPLTLYADSARTVIKHTHAAGRVCVADSIVADPRAGLRDLLPPLALPQLDLLAGDQPFGTADAPIPRVTWIDAQLSDATGHPFVTLTGSTEIGPAILIVDAETGRLYSFAVMIPGDEPMRLEKEERGLRSKKGQVRVRSS